MRWTYSDCNTTASFCSYKGLYVSIDIEYSLQLINPQYCSSHSSTTVLWCSHLAWDIYSCTLPVYGTTLPYMKVYVTSLQHSPIQTSVDYNTSLSTYRTSIAQNIFPIKSIGHEYKLFSFSIRQNRCCDGRYVGSYIHIVWYRPHTINR